MATYMTPASRSRARRLACPPTPTAPTSRVQPDLAGFAQALDEERLVWRGVRGQAADELNGQHRTGRSVRQGPTAVAGAGGPRTRGPGGGGRQGPATARATP
jgi:hypothetical protein